MKRRELLTVLGAAALGAPFVAAPSARAMDRIASGGRLRLSVPLALSSFDPHDLSSLDAAVFGSALFDTLYALDEQGRPYPTLAKALPEPSAGGFVVSLRAGLRSSSDKSVDAKDAYFAFERAKAGAAQRRLNGFGKVRFIVTAEPASTKVDPKPIRPTSEDVTRLATALAHPTTALVPRGFSPSRPEGTGPFRARSLGDGVTFERNPFAARGPAFLESMSVRRASDLASSLRAFEAGEVDVGWLASGLHQARSKATRFDAGPIGLVLLATGQKLTGWTSPGIAQAVLDGTDRSALAALGVHPLSAGRAGLVRALDSRTTWQGPSTELLVDGSSPQLVAIARSLVELLGGGARGLSVAPTPPADLARVRQSGDFGLLLDFVQSTGSKDHLDALLARTGASASPTEPVESVTRRLRAGIVGELHVQGASLDSYGGVASWQLGDIHLVRRD
jgi:peptide/nickel transport system substrate-binding protein